MKAGGAFHTPLVQPAQVQLSAAIVEIKPGGQSPKRAVWRDAVHDPIRPVCEVDDIMVLLNKQPANAVFWEQSEREIAEESIGDLYEVGTIEQVEAGRYRPSTTSAACSRTPSPGGSL